MNFLQAGDIVDIIAPGYGAVQHDVDAAADYLREIGLVPRVPPDLLGDDLLSASDDATRLRLVKEALLADDSRAVWALKGGYGTSEIAPALVGLEPPSQPKWLVGFSDITALHNVVHQNWDWPSLHAPVLWQIARGKVDKPSITATEDVLFGRVSELRYELKALNQLSERSTREPALSRAPFETLVNVSREQTIIGGNMMLLQCSIGTNWQPKLAGNILFLEDIDETAYRVARVLNHMQQAGWFERVSALVIGDFSYVDRADDSKKTDQVIAEFCENLAVPAYRVQDIGHENTNMPLPLNTPAVVKGGELVVGV